MLYLSLVQTINYYASCSVWGQCSRKYMYVEKLTRLQKRAARVVTGNFDYVNCHGMDLVRKLK